MNQLKVFYSSLIAIAVLFTMSFVIMKNEKVILIDVGHGGSDTGAMYQEMTEYQINASIGQKIKALADLEGIDVRLIGATDEFISIQDRVNKINEINPDLVISLHVGAHENSDVRLLNAFYSQEVANADIVTKLSQDLITGVTKETSLTKGKVLTSRFKVIESNVRPSVLLEIGNINNTEDRKLITSKIDQDKIAENILAIISK